ncbi:hypothetical protein B0H13DRAFT_516875 [Mycena leptocephala]|nr:hypothetical protein B0H13DRAFT_516875 [Mycena leptocephala]
MQASLRPFAVRSFLWAKASRCTRITPLTGRLGTRNFAVPPSSDPGIPSSPESALSSQPTGSWDESAERKGKYCGFAPVVEFIPLPAQPSVPDNENPPPSMRFTGKKENLQRQAELSPLDDIIPHLDRSPSQSSGTEGEHASDDTPEGKSGSDGTPPTTTTKEARKARAKAKRKEKKLQSKEALKTQSPPPSIAKEVSFDRLSSCTESGHTSNSTPNEPESQNGSYGTPPITNQKEEEREAKRLLKKAKSKEKKSQRKNLKEAMKTESPATMAPGLASHRRRGFRRNSNACWTPAAPGFRSPSREEHYGHCSTAR